MCHLGLASAILLAASSTLAQAPPPPGGRMRGPNSQPQPPPVPPERQCSIEGVITNAVSGDLLKKASVTLRRADGAPGASYAAVTDAAGHYQFTGLQPGKYMLTADRTGFVRQQYIPKGSSRSSGASLSLAESQNVRGLDIKLQPQGVISGRVVDEDGEPLQGVQLHILRTQYVRGKKRLMPSDNASTNDLGEYRLYGLAPGRYFLMAQNRRFNNRGDGTQTPTAESYVPIYFPSATTPDAAAPIEIAPGTQLQGMDLRLRKLRTVSIKGQVLGNAPAAAGRPNRGVNVALTARDGGVPGEVSQNNSRVVDAQGNFVIANVTPGSYILTATSFEQNNMQTARVPIEVGATPIEGLRLQLAPAGELKGQIKTEGTNQVSISAARVTLMTARGNMFGPGPRGGQLQSDGTFVIQNVQADRYDVRVTNPDGTYVKSIRLGEADVTDTGIDFTNGVQAGAHITIVLGTNPGQIDGTVQNDKSEPAGGAAVVLVPEGARRANDMFYRLASAEPNGQFSMKNIAPGEYRLYAFDNVEGSAYQDPDWLKPFESRSEKMTIKESARETSTLKLVAVGSN